VIGGILVLYLFGIPGLAWFADLSITQATVAMWVFIPGDLVKAVVAALITRGVHQAYPGLLQERRRPKVTSPA
jgi:biotin transport system substrate-specific component